MINEEFEDIINVVQRWEALGLLDGIPIQEKTELAQIFDNATRLMLSERSINKIPKEISEIYDNLYLPICRRLYKRVGPNFNLEVMMGKLLEVVNEEGKNILNFDPEKPAKNPIVEFCVNFADNYEDELTNKNTISDKEYEEKVDSLLSKIKEVLINEEMVSYVDKVEDGYELNISKTKRPTQQKRFWNQSVAKQLFTSALSNINKGG